MIKVIFDTNSICNIECKNFLGFRHELKRFLEYSQVIIPDLVIEELKQQKREQLISNRDSFLDNPFHYLRKIDPAGTKNFDIESHISILAENETLPYMVISLTRATALEEIKNLCLSHHPPFADKKTNSDKGFKDAYIYFTILDFLDNCDGEQIFFVNKDGRFKKAFQDNTQIIVVSDFEEFEKYLRNYFTEDYFISRLQEEISANITADCIKDSWLNTEETWVLKIACDNKIYYVEVDFSSREYMGFNDFDFTEGISNLISSSEFQITHNSIEILRNYIKYFSNQDINKLIEAAATNEKIFTISNEDDVEDFFVSIFKAKSQIIPEDMKAKFKQHFSFEEEND